MNILFLTNAPILHSNGLGNTLLNIFGTIDDVNIYNIYCRYDRLDEDQGIRYFQITEKMLIANLKNKQLPVGKEVNGPARGSSSLSHREQQRFDSGRRLRWQIFFWIRDFIWKIGRWKSPELKQFLQETKPDVIFQTIFFSSYINDIALFVKDNSDAPMIGYMPDDNYSLHQFRFSPFFWVDRIWKRQKVKRTIEQCDLLYVISQVQKSECDQAFKRKCKILTKSADFNGEIPFWSEPTGVVKLLYTGNLGAGRWKSLALIANAVEHLNREGYSVKLDTYSATPQTKAMQKALNRKGCALNGPVSHQKVQCLQREADILIHVEGLSLKSRMAVHQSFSTKLVDYFALGKCIFAVGTSDVASIRHLLDNDAAIVAQTKEEVYSQLKQILDAPELLQTYRENAYLCGRNHHDKTTMQTMLMNDLKRVIEEHENSAN